jgi:polyribonucleotide nucleotidyltransferase
MNILGSTNGAYTWTLNRTGSEVLTLASGLTNISTDQNIERINLPLSLSSYSIQQTGNLINIFDSSATTLVLKTPVQADADGTVIATLGETSVMANVTFARSAKPGQDFFPLTVDYIEKTYAAGKIPGSFFKREGRPSELETLTSRLIDRPLRPLFPEGFYNEVQVVVHVLSLNPEVSADIAALIGSSAALAISGIPFDGPIGAARVGYVNGEYVLNPGKTQLLDSKMDLVVAGT